MEVLVYVLIASTVGLGVLLALVYSIQKDNIDRLNSVVGELNRTVNKRAINSVLLHEMLVPIVISLYKEDLDLVLETDYHKRTFYTVEYIQTKGIIVRFTPNHLLHDFCVPITEVLNRAKELKELQSKLCCKKKTKKTTKKVSKKKGK